MFCPVCLGHSPDHKAVTQFWSLTPCQVLMTGTNHPLGHLLVFSLVCLKLCSPVQAGHAELLWPNPRDAVTVIPGMRQIPGEGGCVQWLCDLWLWLQLRSHSGVWVAKLVLVEQSAQAAAWDGDLALQHHVGTVTGSWGAVQGLWQHLHHLQKSHRKPGRGWDDFSFAGTVTTPCYASLCRAWRAPAVCSSSSSGLVAAWPAAPPATSHLLERGREGQQGLARSSCSPEQAVGMGRLWGSIPPGVQDVGLCVGIGRDASCKWPLQGVLLWTLGHAPLTVVELK